MKISLTGASGFIGRKLVDSLLADGHHLSILGRTVAAEAAWRRAIDHARRAGSLREEAQALSWILIGSWYGPAPVEEAILRCRKALAGSPTRQVEAMALIEQGPLLAMRGDFAEAERLLEVMEHQTSPGGLLPEQVWDAADIPERELFNGRPSGSAMPLVWAHAEYIKLLRSLRDGRVFDMPPESVQRYQVDRIRSPFAMWRFNHKCRSIPAGKVLRVEVLAPAIVHWSRDAWHMVEDTRTWDTGLGVHVADLPTDALPPGARAVFTFFWPEADRWEGIDFAVTIDAARDAP